MIIERTKKEAIFRLPSSTKIDELQEIANLFKFQKIAKKSKAKQKDAGELVKLIKKERWLKTKNDLVYENCCRHKYFV